MWLREVEWMFPDKHGKAEMQHKVISHTGISDTGEEVWV